MLEKESTNLTAPLSGNILSIGRVYGLYLFKYLNDSFLTNSNLVIKIHWTELQINSIRNLQTKEFSPLNPFATAILPRYN